jgi:hypothetical protein
MLEFANKFCFQNQLPLLSMSQTMKKVFLHLKGQVPLKFKKMSRDPVTRFLTSDFFINHYSWAPDPRVEAILYMTSYSQRYSIMKSTFLVVSCVNDTAAPVPVQSHWSSVSYLCQRCHWHPPPLSGVIDTADHKKSDLKVEYLGEYESTVYAIRL